LKIIGITGGIGSGKSTAAKVFRAKGIDVIDADEISRNIVSKSDDVLSELVQTFGDSILGADQKLDRQKLAGVVFKDMDALKKLNKILHAQIAVEIKIQLKSLEKSGAKIAVIDVPLPVKDGFLGVCDEVWVMDADSETRIQRLMATRGYSREACLLRIKNQPTQEKYLALADKVFDNNGTEIELVQKVSEAIGALDIKPK